MKDSQLFLVVGVLLTIDITIMTTWHLADPFYREIQQLKSYVSLSSELTGSDTELIKVDYEKDDTEFIVKPQNENCKSDKMTIFVGVIYAYKGLLLVSEECRVEVCLEVQCSVCGVVYMIYGS